MTRPGLRRFMPHGFVALSLCAVTLLSALTVAPSGVVADTPGGQSSSYTVPALDANNCVLYSPIFNNGVNGRTSTLVLTHDATNSTTINVRARRLGGGTLIDRNFTMAGHELLSLAPSDLTLPAAFSGSLEVFVAGTVSDLTLPIAFSESLGFVVAGGFTVTPATATPTATVIPTAGTVTPTVTPTPTRTVTPTATPPPCGISGVVLHDMDGGDRMTVEMLRQNDPRADLFVPAVHNNDNGFNTEVIIQNTNRDSDVTAILTFRPDSGAARVERPITIRANASTSVDLTAAPQGLSTLEIDGPSGARLVATAFTTGPGGMAVGVNAFGAGANQMSLPLLFRRAGSENAYSSLVRVMKIRPGALVPKITFWDQATGTQIGPIVARRADGTDAVLRENEAFTWDLTQITQLVDGKVYSARVDSDERQEMVAMAAHTNMGRGTLAGYSGINESATDRVISAPYIVKGQDNISIGIQFRNHSGNDASVTVRFFSRLGNRVHTESLTVPSFESRTIYVPAISDIDLPNGAYTAEITSSSAIGAVVNVVRYR